METFLEITIGYPDEIPQTLFRYFLLFATIKYLSHLEDKWRRLKQEGKDITLFDEDEDEDDSWDYIR